MSIELDECQFWVKSMDCENELDPTEALHQKILLYCISVIAWAITKILYIKGLLQNLDSGLDWTGLWTHSFSLHELKENNLIVSLVHDLDSA